MTAVEKGRFCNSCQKTVYDFTQLSDRQIIHKINSEPNSCGRFLHTQLNKDLQLPKEKSSIWIAGVSGILSFLSIGNHEIFAQETVKTELTAETNNTEKTIDGSTSGIKISGVVFDSQKLPLPIVNVTVKGTSISTQTDFDGKFSIMAKIGDKLDFEYVGYETKTITIASQKKITTVLMEEPLVGIGDIVVITGNLEVQRTFFGRIFHSIGNIFR